MLVDQHVFCGSLNVADPYSGARYGDGSFRDLNIIIRDQDARSVRAFFLDLLIQNDKLDPGNININQIITDFAELDLKYNSQSLPSQPFNFEFLEEMPPKKTEVTSKLLEII
jgi:phosphatidylserine/phosphatidylglycerophosphate/cardiolipin synthase-like enzyme